MKKQDSKVRKTRYQEIIIDMVLNNRSTFDVLETSSFSFSFILGNYIINITNLNTMSPRFFCTLASKFTIRHNDKIDLPPYYELDENLLAKINKIIRRCLDRGVKNSRDLSIKRFYKKESRFIRYYYEKSNTTSRNNQKTN